MQDGVLAVVQTQKNSQLHGDEAEERDDQHRLMWQRVLAESGALNGKAHQGRCPLCQAHFQQHGVHWILHSANIGVISAGFCQASMVHQCTAP